MCGLPWRNKQTKEEACQRAASHRDLYAQKRIFFPNTASNAFGRRQPCRTHFSCLEKKSSVLGCSAVLNKRFFFTVAANVRRNTCCISRALTAAGEEKICSKPYKSLCETAQSTLLSLFQTTRYAKNVERNYQKLPYIVLPKFGNCGTLCITGSGNRNKP